MILKVGKVIYSLLINDKDVLQLVNKKVYPLIADKDTTFPFIIYKRTNVEVVTSKDRLINKEGATIEIVIAADKYEDSISLSEAVLKALNNKRGNIAGMNVRNITLVSADEDYIEDTFILKLTFKIEL